MTFCTEKLKKYPAEPEQKPLNVFVHVPKTAGTSLRTRVIDYHGPEDTWVYSASSGLFFRADKMLFQPAETDTRKVRVLKHRLFTPITRGLIYCNNMRADSIEEVHAEANAVIGHFPHTMFDDMPPTREVRKFTVLRNPLARMVSHYRYLQSYRNVGRHLLGWMRHDNGELSFKDFALSPGVQNFQTKLTGTNLQEYAAVGLTENLPEFLCLAGLASYATSAPHHNKTLLRNNGLCSAANDPGFVRDFVEFHAADYTAYEEAQMSA